MSVRKANFANGFIESDGDRSVRYLDENELVHSIRAMTFIHPMEGEITLGFFRHSGSEGNFSFISSAAIDNSQTVSSRRLPRVNLTINGASEVMCVEVAEITLLNDNVVTHPRVTTLDTANLKPGSLDLE